jgi:hypothetical protein
MAPIPEANTLTHTMSRGEGSDYLDEKGYTDCPESGREKMIYIEGGIQ